VLIKKIEELEGIAIKEKINVNEFYNIAPEAFLKTKKSRH